MGMGGLLSLASEVLTIFRADTSDMIKAIKDLEGEQRALAEVELGHAKERNEGLDEWKKGLGEVRDAWRVLKEVGEYFWEGYTKSIEETKLANAAGRVDIEGLSKAANGLKDDFDLLTFAARANKSAFHDNQETLEMATRAMRALEQRGVDGAEATHAVTEALVTGRVRGLEPYGIILDKTGLKLDAMGEPLDTIEQKLETHKRLLAALKPVANEVIDGQDGIGESMRRTAVQLGDAWEEVQKSLGKLATAFGPVLDGITTLLKYTVEVVKALDGLTREGSVTALKRMGMDEVDIRKYLDHYDAENQARRTSVTALNQQHAGLGDFAAAQGASNEQLATAIQHDALAYANDELKKAADGALLDNANRIQAGATAWWSKFYANAFPEIEVDKYEWHLKPETEEQKREAVERAAKSILRSASSVLERNLASVSGWKATTDRLQGLGAQSGHYDKFGKWRDDRDYTDSNQLPALPPPTESVQAEYDRFKQAHEASFLEKTFGKVEDFDVYKKAFDALTGGVKASLDAWIAGSESAGVAFKKFIGSALAGEASFMAVEAIKEGAMALGSLAFGDLRGAATHGAAAAEFAAGAALAAIVARELGAGGSTPKTAGGRSSSGGGSAPASTPANSNAAVGFSPTFVIGDSFAEETPRMRGIRAQQLVALGQGTNGVVYA